MRPAHRPRTAVVTIAHGRHDHLERQHRSLAAGTRLPDLYVVVAMDDETLRPTTIDGLEREVVHLGSDPCGLPLARARNVGVDAAVAAGADVVVLLDVDCLAGGDLVAAYADAVTADPATVWSGPVTYLLPPPPGGYDLASLVDDPHPARPAPPPGTRETDGDPDLFWSLSFAMSATAWRHTGGFHEAYAGYGGEDTDFGRTVVARGLGLGWDGGARAFHQHHEVERPPTRHLDDILRNGRVFADRWGSWPMGGWLEDFAAMGLVERDVDGWVRARRPPVTAVRVVVPARDEQEHVGACVASVLHSIETLRHERPGVSARVVVVLDRCTDRTAQVLTAYDVEVLAVDAGCVGGARRAGVEHVAADAVPAAEVLVVNTDADCEVPSRWLVEHVDLAATHDLVQGEVRPDPADLTADGLASWQLRNPAGRGSLHGANLAFRLDAYLAVGGFAEVADQEDLLLVRALKAAGRSAVCGGATVMTSGRRVGRAPGGFAGYLRDLDALGSSVTEPGPA